jgi:acetylornithine deacetylase
VTFLAEHAGLPPGTVPFYTEAELYRSGLGVPTVVCGPGAIDKAHRVDESILFDELEQGVTLYADAITAFCG